MQSESCKFRLQRLVRVMTHIIILSSQLRTDQTLHLSTGEVAGTLLKELLHWTNSTSDIKATLKYGSALKCLFKKKNTQTKQKKKILKLWQLVNIKESHTTAWMQTAVAPSFMYRGSLIKQAGVNLLGGHNEAWVLGLCICMGLDLILYL